MCIKRKNKSKEGLFFILFIKEAMNGNDKYLPVVKEILIETSRLAKNEISLCDLDRECLKIKLYLYKNYLSLLEEINENNL